MGTSSLLPLKLDHKPVLLEEVKRAFGEHFAFDQAVYGVDGTFGRGGHYKALKEQHPQLSLLAVDQDPEAILYAQSKFKEEMLSGMLEVVHANFAETKKISSYLKPNLDFVFLDIGVSSPQLDNPERGFSFYHDGPLDMRMNPNQGQSAAEVLNTMGLAELRSVFLEFGEIYAPDRLLEAISDFRQSKPFETTLELANLVEAKCGWRKRGQHPATLYFQALRIYVNQELEVLKEALNFYSQALRVGGVFFVISFHSLEDRMIKRFFKTNALGKPVNKKVIKPSREEEKSNPRARSAKLRVFKKEVQ